MSKFTKDPESVLDYTVNWETWLDGDTISASSWTVPTGLTEDSDTFGNSTATVWLSGGSVGRRYDIVNHITTAAAREEDQTLTIICEHK